MTKQFSYWISTVGRRRMLMTLYADQRPNDAFTAMYGMKRTNKLVYNIFKKTKINLLAKDMFAWLRN